MGTGPGHRDATATDAPHRGAAAAIVLAWLLARSPQMRARPGSDPRSVAQNVAAASALSDDEVAAISKGG
jgi:hypothetical protein